MFINAFDRKKQFILDKDKLNMQNMYFFFNIETGVLLYSSLYPLGMIS